MEGRADCGDDNEVWKGLEYEKQMEMDDKETVKKQSGNNVFHFSLPFRSYVPQSSSLKEMIVKCKMLFSQRLL